ncbi:hypothetical protein LJR289_004396 [Pseudoduganella sp. LjRoot289]|uniref:post-PEP-CTERM-1 domain-containing protein n=1 Tax=Pseudoduganella sp. LjRoot289 TaxID=3342314 RepID=UPI003ECCFB05
MSKNKHTSQRLLRAAGATLALLGATAVPPSAQAQTQAQPQTESLAALETGIGASDDITVVRDAESGKLRAPTAEEHAALKKKSSANARVQRAAPPPPMQKFHASGARGARLTDEFVSSAVMVRGPDGKLAAQCVDSHDAAEGIHKAGHIHTTKATAE